jgi:hypothetical protein
MATPATVQKSAKVFKIGPVVFRVTELGEGKIKLLVTGHFNIAPIERTLSEVEAQLLMRFTWDLMSHVGFRPENDELDGKEFTR